MKILRYLLLFVFLSVQVLAQEVPVILKTNAQSNIIPQPVRINIKSGHFIIDQNTSVSYPKGNKEIEALVFFLTDHLRNISGFNLPLNKKSDKRIELILSGVDDIGKEAYTLNVSPKQIFISANTKEGLFYGVQSVIQCLPAIRTNEPLKVPCMEVLDYPRFGWRGMMLDVSRHFYPVEAIKEIIDLLALYKMNVFHWHLVDNEGWRLEIKKYPKLTKVGAWRDEIYGSVWYAKDSTLDRNDTYRYGGYYTQKEAKEVVKYARARNITVIPEIEMPGHSGAVLAAYPQLSCNNQEQAVPNSATMNGAFGHEHVNFEYCAGKDSSFLFLQDILKEVIEIFPSEYIHIGGDEVDKSHWQKCANCRKRMQDEGLKDEHQLQSYFIRRIEKFLLANNKKLLGWDEILEGGLAPTATVMSWRGEKGGIEAAKMGHEVVMSPSNPLYFNRYQAGPDGEPHAAKYSINTLDKVYDYNPHPKGLNNKEIKLIKGGQFAIWTEFISSVEHLEYMLLPRLPAIAESLWTPLESKDYRNFVERLNQWHFNSWKNQGIRFHQALYKK